MKERIDECIILTNQTDSPQFKPWAKLWNEAKATVAAVFFITLICYVFTTIGIKFLCVFAV